jgi:gelsolin
VGLKIWRIENFQVKPWPKEQHGQFFTGDSYIVLKTYKVDGSESLKHDIHIWIGNESSQDEYGTAAYKMVEADEYLGGTPVQHRQVQGRESPAFSDYFHTLEYLQGGVASGFNKVEPTVDKPLFFRVKGTNAKSLKMTQIPLSIQSMNEGDSFILYASRDKVWCWHGKKVRRRKICCYIRFWHSTPIKWFHFTSIITSYFFRQALSRRHRQMRGLKVFAPCLPW